MPRSRPAMFFERRPLGMEVSISDREFETPQLTDQWAFALQTRGRCGIDGMTTGQPNCGRRRQSISCAATRSGESRGAARRYCDGQDAG
jgi:hypothetical protein